MQQRTRWSVTLLAIAIATTAHAQVDTGVINGRVTDPSGSAVPNVQVGVVQPATGLRFQTVSNAEGIYRVQSLAPGIYELTFEAAGFKKLVQGNVVLQTGAVLPVDVR